MHAIPFTKSASLLLSALVIAVPLTGCDDKSDAKAATQVAAKVNGAEISVHQINAMLAKANGITSENAPRVRQEVLDRLIDQQILVEQAIARKLDRNPDVLLNIEAARRDILARSYLDQIAAALPKPSDDEIKRYYDENPDLFAKRRVYNIQELVIPKTGAALDDLKTLAASGKTLEEVAGWLKSKGIPARGNAGIRPAEQLSLDILPKVARMKDGQTALIEGPQQIYVMHVAASQAAPVDEAAAKPLIQQFLQNQRNTQAIGDEVKKLKDAAKIERIGDFAAAAAPAAPAAAQTPAAGTEKTEGKAIEKGIAGLK